MKALLKLRILLLSLLAIFIFLGCQKDTLTNDDDIHVSFTDLKVAENFTWRTSKTLKIDLTVTDADNNPVETELRFFSHYPGGIELLNGVSRVDGKFKRKYTVAAARESLILVIPNHAPITLGFNETTIHNFPAYEIVEHIIVENTVPKNTPLNTSAHFPSEGQFGTIVFEDHWPYILDYDMNDVVIDYNVIANFNSEDLVTDIQMTLYLRASGAGLDNGFGISFRHSWSNGGPYPDIESVLVNNEPVAAEDTEYPSFIIIESTMDVMPTYNTFPDLPFVQPIRYDVEITFATPISEWDIELPMQNPFIFVNQDRGREVHLPFDPPTSLADPIWFGMGQDATDPMVLSGTKAVGGFFTYMTEDWYPWALNIYFETGSNELFHYPPEGISIDSAYSSFQGWVETWSPMDWYLPEYHVPGNIYNTVPDYGE